MHCLKTQ